MAYHEHWLAAAVAPLHQAGLTPAELGEWEVLKWAPQVLLDWMGAGFSAAEHPQWVGVAGLPIAGLAAQLSEQGHTPHQVAEIAGLVDPARRNRFSLREEDWTLIAAWLTIPISQKRRALCICAGLNPAEAVDTDAADIDLQVVAPLRGTQTHTA